MKSEDLVKRLQEELELGEFGFSPEEKKQLATLSQDLLQKLVSQVECVKWQGRGSADPNGPPM